MKIKEVIVVEGKHDSQRLKRFFDVDTIETNGLHLSSERIKYIHSLQEKRGVVLFLDPDSAGERIRHRLNCAIPSLKNAFIDKKKCRTSKKVGIEHASQEALAEALSNTITYTNEIKQTLSYAEYLELGFHGRSDAKALRSYIGNVLFLGECNSKTLFKRLNMYQIHSDELRKIIEEYDG